MRNLAIVIGLVTAAGAEATACSSHFDSCVDSRTCASTGGDGGSGTAHSGATASAGSGATADDGGNGGEAAAVGDSEGGAGGAAPIVACAKDSECSDGLACNGSETCKDGFCASGTPPCANPDPVHCDAVCTEVAGAASCAVQGQDADHDGHLTNACAAKPGDDCNDSDATTHPGATEICDGVDHNCNGKLAINDGLALSGTVSEIGVSGKPRSSPSIAWATDRSAYGIAHGDRSSGNTTEGVYFQMIDQAGASTLPLKRLTTSPPYSVSLIWGGDQFGMLWADGAFAANFTTVSSAGVAGAFLQFSVPYGGAHVPSNIPLGLARAPGGDWDVLFSNSAVDVPNRDWIGTVSATGVKSSNLVSVSPSGVPGGGESITTSGPNFVIGYSGSSAASVAMWDASLSSSTAISVVGQAPILGSSPNGFAVALAPAVTGKAPQFYAFGPSGSPLCGPVDLADASFVPAAIVATPKGYLVGSSGALRIQEMLANCTPGVAFTVDAGPVSNVGIAAGNKGYGVVWQDTSAGVPKRRFFGPNFCN
jgi:Putative metal-binding motif